MKNDEEHKDDVVFEDDIDTEQVSSFGGGNEDSKVKKLQQKLKEAEQKARENLDGWQRLKADVANGKKEESERLTRARARGTEAVLESLLPALDSFDSAMQGDAWNSIDHAWRTGMEFVHGQLIGALESHGVSVFGSVGDTFDIASHDAAEHVTVNDESKNEKVHRVLVRGYKNGNNVIRPARVVVGEFKA